MRMMILTKAERGNTNEGLDVQFQNYNADPTQADPLMFLADTIEWEIDGAAVVAIGVQYADGWRVMSAEQFDALVAERKEAKAEVEVEKMLEVMAAFPGSTAWSVGDYVAWPLGKESYCIGFIKAIDAGIATIYEVNAFHKVWGSSGNSRGMLHHVPLEQLHACPTYYKHIVKEAKEKA